MSDPSPLPLRPDTPPPTAPAASPPTAPKVVLICLGVIGIVGVVAGAWALITHMLSNPAQAAAWRDIFIIFMAIESLVIGVALTILIIQLAVLTNMLRHEIKPMLESTSETINTVRGTAIFMSERLIEPVVKLNSYVASISRAVEIINALFSLKRKGN